MLAEGIALDKARLLLPTLVVIKVVSLALCRLLDFTLVMLLVPRRFFLVGLMSYFLANHFGHVAQEIDTSTPHCRIG